MINLLPLEEKKHVHRIYVIRLSIVILTLSLIAISAGATFLFPSLFLIIAKENQLERDVLSLGGESASGTDKETEDIILKTNWQVEMLERGDSVRISEAILDVADKKTNLINLTGYFFQKTGKEESRTNKLVIRGNASTRNELLAFAGRLKKSVFLASVELPVSDLAQSEDIKFSITAAVTASAQE